MMPSPLIEICVEGIDGLAAAQAGGADRVELCASLLEGGLTPSMGVVKQAVAVSMIPFYVIIRPRGGDFLYSELEFLTMLDDVRSCRELGVSGVVIGCLTADGRIDESRMGELVEAARPMKVTCHRAFDMTRDPEEAIEALVRCGVDRVLTSGQRDSALEGIDVLKRMHDAARGRILIMACGGLDESNIAEVLHRSEADELHFKALLTRPSGMKFRNPSVGMGDTSLEREFEVTVTDTNAVRRTIMAARKAEAVVAA
jgi:copper homeostasis protein